MYKTVTWNTGAAATRFQLKNKKKKKAASSKPQASSAKLQAPRPALMLPQLKNKIKIESMKEKTITIEVYGGCVTEVTGLPEGYDYEIIDHDHKESEEDES